MPENRPNPQPNQPKRRGGGMGFGPGGGRGMMAGPKAKNAKKAARRLLQFLRPYRVRIFLGLLMTVISTVISILGPRQFGDATTILSKGVMGMLTGGPGIDFEALGALMARLMLVYGGSTLFWWLSGFLLAKVATQAGYALRGTILKKINRMPLAYFNSTTHGDVLSRITNDVDTLGHSLNQGISQVLYSGVMIAGLMVMMFLSSWQMALVAIGILPVMVLATGLIIRKSQKYFKRQQDFLGAVNGQVEEVYAGHTVVKAFGGEEKVINEFDEHNNKLYHANWRAQFLSGVMHPLANFFGNLNYVAMCVLGAYLVAKGTLDIGKIAEFILYIRQFNQPIMQLAQIMNVFQQTAAAAERVFEFLDEPEEALPGQTAEAKRQDAAQKEAASQPHAASPLQKAALRTDRGLLKPVLLSIVTFGIYGLWYWYHFAKDVNTVCEGDGRHTMNYPGMVLLSIPTLGIYGLVWTFQMLRRLEAAGERYQVKTESASLVFLWHCLGSFLFGIGVLVAQFYELQNLNGLCAAYNAALPQAAPKIPQTPADAPAAAFTLPVALPFAIEPLPPVEGNITFEHVKFGYEDSDEIVINDFSAEIKAGQKIAIVGPTGAGKTTLVKLLMRFHDLKEGAIYIDGHNIAAYPRAEVRKAMGMVLQDTWLTNDTVANNIRYGRLGASHDEVRVAARAAQAHSFIRALPGSYGMVINEEANNISQGQKQLLTIARAVLADNRILILDEATSSVDTRTEILIQKAMDKLMEGRTSFIIAHRLSTVRNADLILCLDHGDIVEQGTHEELLARDGFYAKIYNSQFERAAA